ncbi:nucleoside transporter C-terminal domain-containing protein [Proteus columbae]|uniref:nucleoside transporter C-terminal domain-containing protein n=1 Tax=Proteus columbae TaxID=1987580 RepID=UPI000C1F0E62|nr:nucleoside transporter C-terminal domain-containing protein [Proteus columbae]
MKYLIFIISLLIIFIVASAISFKTREIKRKAIPIVVLLLIEAIVAFIFLHTSVGTTILNTTSMGLEYLIRHANKGIDFVFGDISHKTPVVFVIVALMPLVFICSIIGILKYFGILRLIILILGSLINKVAKVGKLESFSAMSAVVVGMMAVYVSIKEYIPNLTKPQMYTIAACSLSTVDIAILGAYTQMLSPQFVFIGVCLNFFSTFVIISIINPNDPVEVPSHFSSFKDEHHSFFEVLTDHMLDGFKLILAIIPMLLGFIALISMLNDIFSYIIGISFQGLLGYIFSPLAFVLGVPWQDSIQFGQIIATKILTNEFVAMVDYIKLENLSPRTEAIMSVFLISFANFGSIGIIIACIASISKEHGKIIAANSFRLIIGSTLVSCLSATMVGIFVS